MADRTDIATFGRAGSSSAPVERPLAVDRGHCDASVAGPTPRRAPDETTTTCARHDRLVIGIFLTALVAPLVATLPAVPHIAAAVSHRSAPLSDKDVSTADAGSPWSRAGDFKNAFEQHFGFRRGLIRLHSLLKLRVLGASPSPTVLLGNDGWLFYADDGALDDYVSARPFTDEELLVWQHTLEHTRDWLRNRGIAYLFVIAPDKHAIYPEHFPKSIRPLSRQSRTDQLVGWMRDHSTVPIVDLRGVLLARKPVERLYHLTDSHWNGRGALTASLEIARQLALHLDGMDVPRHDDFTPTATVGPGQDLARMLGLEDTLHEQILDVVPLSPRQARIVEPEHPDPSLGEARLVTERAKPALPRAVVFRDSFASALVPFLSEHFSRAVYLWQRDFDPDVVRRERPDVVIHELAGRFLTAHWPYDAVADEARRMTD